MKKRLLAVLLAALMLCSLAPGPLAAELTPVSSANENAQSYHQGSSEGNMNFSRFASPGNSYLIEQGDGFCRVEYVPGDPAQLVVETYGADRSIRSQRMLEMELPLFGGFFAGKDANYFVFGKAQPTKTGDDSEEIIRVVKYSKDFERLGSVSIYGNNTTVPFRGGSLRMVEDGAYLYVHTCHEMYQSNDGINHQANLAFVVRKSDLTVTDIRSGVVSYDFGYVSHSFNQFIVLDEGKIVTLDHGDAYPRTAYLYRCGAADSDGKYLPSFSNGKDGEGVSLMTFPSTEEHYNATGASLGGLVATATHYIVAGTSVDPSEENLSLDASQRNIFVCAVPKNSLRESSVQTYWLTRYPSVVSEEDAVRVSTPHLVLLPDGRAMVLWTLDNTLFYQLLGANGAPVGEVKTRVGALSDCAPTVIRGLVQWYVTDGGAPVFYAIDPNGQAHTKHEPCVQGAKDPDCLYEGYTGDTVCIVCGELLEKGSVIPARGHTWDAGEVEQEPTCTDSGSRLLKCTDCGAWTYQHLPALGHDWSEWVTVTAAAEDSDGWETRTCARCGETETRRIPRIGHTHEMVYSEGEEPTCEYSGLLDVYFCGGCGLIFSDPEGQHQLDDAVIPPLGHHYVDIVTAPTCTEYGQVIRSCDRCGDSIYGDYNTPTLGHDWGAWRATKPATLDSDGEETRSCTRCGESEHHIVARLTPDQTPVTPANPFTDVPKGKYYYDPVLWAVNHVPQITNGTSPTTFSPNATCTRGQVVTFLWRAMGCPEPKSTKNPFTDVKADDYYYKPVLWAVEKGITQGTSKTTFSPNSPCTRAHVVTFLWRSEGQSKVDAKNPFTDVKSGDYYYSAVLWAVKQGITQGTSATAFSPNAPCTRGQIVTFLYRDLGK